MISKTLLPITNNRTFQDLCYRDYNSKQLPVASAWKNAGIYTPFFAMNEPYVRERLNTSRVWKEIFFSDQSYLHQSTSLKHLANSETQRDVTSPY